MPTEAEWEYGCRAGLETPYSVGDRTKLTAADCHFDQPWASGHTIPVDAKKPNRWGLFQMHGNALEWCEDWSGSYTDGGGRPQENPTGPERGSDRVDRGGSWGGSAGGCRSAVRGWSRPGDRYRVLGFRLAAVPVGPPASQE